MNPLSVINCIILCVGATTVLLAACLVLLICLLLRLKEQQVLLRQLHGAITTVPKLNTDLRDVNH